MEQQPSLQPARETAATERLLKILYFVLFGTVGLYWIVLEMVAAEVEPRELGAVKTLLQALAVAAGAAVLYVRFARIPAALNALGLQLEQRLTPLRINYIVCFALAEAVAIYGFVLRLVGSSREEAALFFFAAAGLFLLCYPRLPESLRWQ